MQSRTSTVVAATLVFAVSFVALSNWLASRRPTPAELRTPTSLIVTSTLDEGRGSLREAILLADRRSERTRIVLQVDRITLSRALPPLLNPGGTILDARAAATILDATAVATGAALEVASPGSELLGLRIVGALDIALLLRAGAVSLTDCSVEGSGAGVVVAGSATARIRSTAFVGNRTGIRLASTAAKLEVEGNQFRDSGEVAIWAVAASDEEAGGSVAITGNRFEGDRIAIIAANVPALITNNVFVQARDAAVHAMGRGVDVIDNRVSAGRLHGLVLSDAEGQQVENNEVEGNRGAGILVSRSQAVTLSQNELYGNGYGLAVVFGDPARPNSAIDNLVADSDVDGILVVGSNPVMRANRVRGNTLAGLRILSFAALDGSTVSANPLIEGNSFSGNPAGATVRGVYREPPSEPVKDDDASGGEP